GMIALPEMMDLIYPYVSKNIPYVMDPVMIATSGDRLVSDEAVDFLKSKLIPVATVITPNRSEAEVLADMSISCESDITTAAKRILHELGPRVVIIKGGHIGDDATDYAFTKDGDVRTWTSPKYDTVHTHGTGCTFSAVITAELAKGRDVMDAIGIAKNYISLAIKHNPALGNGCGPVNHMAYGLLVNGPQTMDELLKND
ncbi:MAG: PfkB family carbohydrate kinase, partial [Veillonella sp.]|nr:PfkB family carbohydrate kinase [Veillonella sp.]